MLMPRAPVSAPLKLRLRRRTALLVSVPAKLSKLILTPFPPPEWRAPAYMSWQSIWIDLVIVTAPKPPGSRQLISPLVAVFEMAPEKVLHGAGRLHGLVSSPTPDTPGPTRLSL